MIPTGIAGISGYTGVELARLVSLHPELELAWAGAGASAGRTLAGSWPGLTGLGGLADLAIEPVDPVRIAEACEVALLALPRGRSLELALELEARDVLVVDLGPDLRLDERAVYGLPERSREGLDEAGIIAAAGCYPTATTLAALPLVEAGLVEGPVVASCVSGASGAGRKPGPRNLYCETHEAVVPYGLAGSHRHVPELERNLGKPVVFSPHVAPMSRGLIATVHLRLGAELSPQALEDLYVARYGSEAFLQLRAEPPCTADARGTNRAHLHVALDEARQTAVVVCALDNLVKGAGGQALQCLNLRLGLPEALGLPAHPLLP